MTRTPPSGVAIAGFGWMGRVHTQAYARVLHHFPQLTVAPQLVAVADEVPGRAEEAAEQFGFASATRDWREVAADPDVAAVSIAAPNFLHREIGVAMAKAGKHIWIEKPVGLTAADARAVADAVKEAGVQSAVGFNYRNAPAVAAARELIASGELGTITHARFRLFSDYAAHPEGALSWRFERERGGSGVLGDLASHGVDLARYLLGDIDSLVSDTATFLTERARPTGATSGHARATGGELGPVENEDYVSSLLRFASGARGTLEASRVAVGRAEQLRLRDPRHQGRRVLGLPPDGRTRRQRRHRLPGPAGQHGVRRPGAGYYAAFQPGSASSMGYDDLKVIEAYNFLRSIAEGTPHGSTLDDAVAQRGWRWTRWPRRRGHGWAGVPGQARRTSTEGRLPPAVRSGHGGGGPGGIGQPWSHDAAGTAREARDGRREAAGHGRPGRARGPAVLVGPRGADRRGRARRRRRGAGRRDGATRPPRSRCWRATTRSRCDAGRPG